MKKIMIIDDEEDTRNMVKEGLEHLTNEYSVIPVRSGDACFEVLRTGDHPDLILLDIIMPAMSGWNVLAQLKETPEWKNIPVVFLTAKSDPFSKGIGQMGAEDYIEKPFSIKELQERIERVLRK